MRTTTTPTLACLLAMLALPPAAAASGGAAPPPDGDSVELVAGHDYALLGISEERPDTIDLIDPTGRVVASVDTISDLEHGTEFRAPYSARYFIRDHDAGAVGKWLVVPDCRGDALTLCRITAGRAKAGDLPWPYDQDWRATRLRAGRTYTIAPDGLNTCVHIADEGGHQLTAYVCQPDVLTYRPEATATYFVATSSNNIDEGTKYGVALQAR